MLQFTPLFFVYAGVTVGAVVMAAFVHAEERCVAFVCACMLLCSWLVQLGSFTPWGVERMLGLAVREHFIDVWSAMNMIAGLFVLLFACGDRLPAARPTWWGPLLFGLLLTACFNDVLFWSTLIDWPTFSHIADVTFLAEESVFFALGAPVAWDRLHSFVRRDLRSKVLAAYQKASLN